MSQGATPDPERAATEASPTDSESEELRFTGALPWQRPRLGFFGRSVFPGIEGANDHVSNFEVARRRRGAGQCAPWCVPRR